MKPPIIFIIFVLACLRLSAQQTDTLTNSKVIELYKAGFGKDILKSKIQTSVTKFDVSIDGLLELKKAGVPDEVINLMISANGQKTNAADNSNNNSIAANTGGKTLNLESGIYYQNSKGDYNEIEPSILTNSKTNRAAQIFISGLINAKTKATLSGKESSFLIYETLPKFYFVFDTTVKSSLNTESNVFFGGTTTSPKEFLLVKLNISKNSREITVGKENIANSDFGIDETSLIRFTSKKISKGVYEVSTDTPFAPGEYCFLFALGIKQGQSTKAFDFGVRPAKGF